MSRQTAARSARVEPGHHLVQRAERLALEAHALGRTRQLHRRRHLAHLDVAQARLRERGLEHAVAAERERPRLAGQRRRQLRALADDLHRDREEGVASRASSRRSPPTRPPGFERVLHAGQRALLVGKVDQADAADDGVERRGRQACRAPRRRARASRRCRPGRRRARRARRARAAPARCRWRAHGRSAPTRRAAASDCSPAPAATSSTRQPGPTRARSNIVSVAAPSQSPRNGPQRCQASAAPCHCARVVVLNAGGVEGARGGACRTVLIVRLLMNGRRSDVGGCAASYRAAHRRRVPVQKSGLAPRSRASA